MLQWMLMWSYQFSTGVGCQCCLLDQTPGGRFLLWWRYRRWGRTRLRLNGTRSGTLILPFRWCWIDNYSKESVFSNTKALLRSSWALKSEHHQWKFTLLNFLSIPYLVILIMTFQNRGKNWIFPRYTFISQVSSSKRFVRSQVLG